MQIDRVESSAFPIVTIELNVQNIHRQPITGLDASNFNLSEAGRDVANQEYLGSQSDQNTGIAVLIERSPQSKELQTEITNALRDINAAMNGNISAIVSAGVNPVLERFNTESEASLAVAARGGAGNAAWSDRWRFDLGLRLSAANLLQLSKKRAVVFVSSGNLGDLSFEQYSLSELAAYLANNAIVFYVVLVGNEEAPPSLKYLCNETGGQVIPLYRPEGIAPILKEMNTKSCGTYILRYESGLFTDFGKAFLPVEAEVQLLDRSGRDVVGYFAPLE
ncbi:MAG: hypothetical protein Ta2B_22860 [Termitinemataceae bacterium]|nr:MAG: hypothetical protein Ta2B_22860 [Termitinemataceae bacterium]